MLLVFNMSPLQAYLNSPRAQRVLSKKPGEEGFSLIELVVVIAVLAILSAVAIPAFTNVQANARAAAVQNAMVNGLKECAVREAENESDLSWASVASFKNASAFRGFTIQQLPTNQQGNDRATDSCYGVEAISNPAGQNSQFQIFLRESDGVAVKYCSDPAKAGCGAGNVWQ